MESDIVTDTISAHHTTAGRLAVLENACDTCDTRPPTYQRRMIARILIIVIFCLTLTILSLVLTNLITTIIILSIIILILCIGYINNAKMRKLQSISRPRTRLKTVIVERMIIVIVVILTALGTYDHNIIKMPHVHFVIFILILLIILLFVLYASDLADVTK